MKTENTAVLDFRLVVRAKSPKIVAPAPAPKPIGKLLRMAAKNIVCLPTINRLPKIMYFVVALKYMKFPNITA